MLQAEVQWQADRANLRRQRHEHPEWSRSQLAQSLQRSLSWVKKWLKRLREAPTSDHNTLFSRSSRPHQTRSALPPDPLIVARILEIRDHPPDDLKRTPGPKTIAYFLQKDPLLKAQQLKPPTSTSFIWKILTKNQRIHQPKSPKAHQPLTRPAPMSCWQIDFKDCSSVTIEPDGKKQHVVEVLNIVDEGTSLLVAAVARSDFNAETALESVIEIVKSQGLPGQMTFDRDPRWVGSHTGRDFPSAFIKLWHCLNVTVKLCPPQRPDLNCYVERYHRSYGSECLAVHRPENLAQVREVTAQYQQHYNWQRPHQGVACGNQPPRQAFPQLPALPGVPLIVDPDRWVERCAGLRFTRKADYRGVIKIDKHHYYVAKELAGQYVQVEIEASQRQLVVRAGKEQAVVKRLAIKGLYGREVAFEEYVNLIVKEARSERRIAQYRARAAHAGATVG